jgi:fibronectin-binding autotransporter adhesin
LSTLRGLTLTDTSTAHGWIVAGSGANALTFNSAAGIAYIAATAGAHTISAPIVTLCDTTASVGDTANTTTLLVSGQITGAGSFNKGGLGTMTLSNNNTFSGGMNIYDGTLILSGANTGNGPVALRKGTLILQNTGALGVSTVSTGAYNLAGPYNVATTIKLLSDNNNDTFTTGGLTTYYSTTVIADQLTAGHTGNTLKLSGGVTITSGTLTVTGNNSYNVDLGNVAGGSGTGSPNLYITPSTANITINNLTATGGGFTTYMYLQGSTTGNVVNGVISNGPSCYLNLRKDGTGTWTLKGVNTQSGANVNNGTLIVAGGATPCGTSSGIALGSGVNSGLLVLGDASGAASCTVGGLSTGGTGSNNAIVGGNTAISTLTANFNGSATSFGGKLGGSVANQNNLAFTKGGSAKFTLTNAANSYLGPTTLNSSTLAVAALANGGLNSSIGASSNAAGNLVLNGGTLQYIGPAASTDRLFTLGTSAVALDASGTDAISFTNTGGIALTGTNSARTFTLTGTNTGSNTLAPVLGNNGNGATALTKTGSGTWILSGANSYTGATTIKSGMLLAGTNALAGANGAFGNSTGSVLLGDTTGSADAGLFLNGPFSTSRPITIQAGNTGTASLGGSTDNNSTFSGRITMNQPLTIGQVATTGSNALSITGGITCGNAGSKTLTIAGPGAINVGGTGISNGSGVLAVRVTGGAIAFSGTNTYTGATTVAAGTLQLTGSALSTSATVASGATLDLARPGNASALAAATPVANDGLLDISTAGQQVGAVSGIGNTSVANSSSLTADSIVQNTLSIGAGGSVTIRETTGAAGNAVPEPSTFVLLAAGVIGILAYRQRKPLHI